MGFMDDLNDMFNKSAAAAGDMLNKGASAAGRMADSANLRFKQGEIDRRWKDACAALGESVIEAVKADPALLSGREQMMADLDAIAKERADVADELQRIAAEATLARNGILSHDAAERGTATVFRDRLPLDVDADDGGTGQLRQPVLHFFPERDIQNVFYGVFKPAHTFDFPSPCRTFEHCHHK